MFAVTVCVFAEYVWTQGVIAIKFLRIQTNPDMCGRTEPYEIISNGVVQGVRSTEILTY